MATVVLFGAGASFGGGEFIPERPPLGNGLYEELARCFKGSWGALPAEVTEMFTDNFERGMAFVWEHWSEAVPTLMQHMAIYFVQFRPKQPGETLYCKFVREIESKNARTRVLLSTLNYECLLEHSISNAGVSVNYGDFPDENAISLWKLHGGCNLIPDGIGASRDVSFTSGVSFGTSIRPVNDLNEVLEFCLGDNALPPVMCMFMLNKPVQVAPESILALQEAWRDQVMSATHIAVVGVYPNSDDTHLWNCLADAPGELIYVGGATAFKNWADEKRGGKPCRVLAERFDVAFDELVELTVRTI